MLDLALPLNYRHELFRSLVETLRQGESCSLVGVGSTGKSNVARHLRRPDVRREYWREISSQVLYLYLDCNSLPAMSDYDLYIKLLELLSEAAAAAGGELAALHPQFEEGWQEAAAEQNAVLAQRKLRQAIGRAIARGAKQIVIALDDCDDLILQSPAALRGLRALRDEHKYQVVYITVTRRELWAIHPERTPDFESFYELLSAHTLAVPPYSREEAEFMLRRLVARSASSRALYEDEIKRIVDVTGGHAGLIKTVYAATKEGQLALDPNLLSMLIKKADLWEECEKIWDSLGESEREALTALTRHQSVSNAALKPLKDKGLVRENQQGRPFIFSPLLALFIEDTRSESGAPSAWMVLDLDDHTLTIKGRRVGPFEKEPFEILCFLYAKRPEVCGRVELLERLRQVQGGPSGRRTLLAEFVDIMNTLKRQINLPDAEFLLQTSEGGYRLRGEDEQT